MTEKTNSALSDQRFGYRLPNKRHAGPLRADGTSLRRDPVPDAIADARTRE